MRIKFLSVILSFLLMSIAISSCLDSDENYDYSSNAMITAFGIDSIGKGIYYKFTIDQLKREIYNIDSLPVGADTIIDRILIDTLTTSGIGITSADTMFTISDSVDLTKPIKLKVYAADGVTTREYTISVRIHKQDPDSLIWKEKGSLSTSPVTGKKKLVTLDDKLLVYTSTTTLYSSPVGNGDSWTMNNSIQGLPSDAKLTSIVKFNNQLYITTESGEALYSDDGILWEVMDMQGMQMVTFVAETPSDEVTGSPNKLVGIYTENGYNYFCTKVAGATEWVKGTETVPSDFPLNDIYATVFTNASGIKQVVVVGNTETTTEATIPWFTMDGLSWVDMSTPTSFSCPSMKNPSIMYYGGLFHMMGGDFNIIRSSRVGIAWSEAATKFRYPTEIEIIPGKDKDDKDTIKYNSLFEGKGDYSLTIDKDNFIWIVWNEDGSVWRGRLNKLGFLIQ